MVLFVYFYKWEEPASIEYRGSIVVPKSHDVRSNESCVERCALSLRFFLFPGLHPLLTTPFYVLFTLPSSTSSAWFSRSLAAVEHACRKLVSELSGEPQLELFTLEGASRPEPCDSEDVLVRLGPRP